MKQRAIDLIISTLKNIFFKYCYVIHKEILIQGFLSFMFILHIFWFLMAAINSFTISSKSLTIKALQQEVLTS